MTLFELLDPQERLLFVLFAAVMAAASLTVALLSLLEVLTA